MSHVNKIYDADPHFTINAITRQIKNDSSQKTTLIQGDHNSERFSFCLDRFVEGHDMTECNRVEVHFNNNGFEDVYEVEDLQIKDDDENKIVFSWLLSRNATQNDGKLEFSIRFACVDNDDNVDYSWNTAVHSGISISKGMNNAGAVVEILPDIINQWSERIFGEAEDTVANINKAKEDALAALQNVTQWTEVDAPGIYDYSFLNEYTDKSYAIKFRYCDARTGFALVMNDHTAEPETALQYVFCGGDTTLRIFIFDRTSRKYSLQSETKFVKSNQLANAINNALYPKPEMTFGDHLEPNKSYNLAVQLDLPLTFPSDANDGDVIYITFESGDTPTTVYFSGSTSEIDLIPEANTGYEIFAKYNGEIWIVGWSDYKRVTS